MWHMGGQASASDEAMNMHQDAYSQAAFVGRRDIGILAKLDSSCGADEGDDLETVLYI